MLPGTKLVQTGAARGVRRLTDCHPEHWPSTCSKQLTTGHQVSGKTQIATELNEPFTPMQEKVYAAVAMAQQETGLGAVPLIQHLAAQGVAPQRILVHHILRQQNTHGKRPANPRQQR